MALGIVLVFAAYFATADRSEVMGKREMREFFLKTRGRRPDR
jgi:hypothetical protein